MIEVSDLQELLFTYHSWFSSSTIIGSACLMDTPRPDEHRHFISPSRTMRKPANGGELKIFTFG